MPQYVAFLRGINVGGRKPLKMDELKSGLAAMNFQNIKTVLASGNVLFDAPKYTVVALGRAIESKVSELLDHDVSVIVRTVAEIKALADLEPFRWVKMTPSTRLYVTFLAEKSETPAVIPADLVSKNLKILNVTPSEVCSVVTITSTQKSLNAMTVIEKQFGEKVTTRSWSTIEKILKAAGA